MSVDLWLRAEFRFSCISISSRAWGVGKSTAKLRILNLFENAVNESEQTLSPKEKEYVDSYKKWKWRFGILGLKGLSDYVPWPKPLVTNDVDYIVLDLNAWVSVCFLPFFLTQRTEIYVFLFQSK